MACFIYVLHSILRTPKIKRDKFMTCMYDVNDNNNDNINDDDNKGSNNNNNNIRII